jgi:DHA1 family bicyclomycin/chloramphenicol resistance-like MFS transporter
LISKLWRDLTRYALQWLEHSRRGSAPAAVDRRSRRVDAAGWFDWLTMPLLSQRRRAPFWLLAAVTATGTLAMHILIPVLPLAAADFSVSRRAIQQAITLYLFGIAGGQLLYGPVSDRFGRRPTLIAALILYIAAGAVAGWAATFGTLLVARVLQAVGGCGGLVLGRAIVRDSAGRGEATSRMALLTMVQSLAPGVGPAVGGFLGARFGWRSILVMLVALGLVTLAGVILAMPETTAARRSGRMLRGYPQLLRSRTFCGYLFGGAFTSTTFFAYLTASPFIFTDMLHRPATEVGLYYLVVLAGVPIGSFGSSRLARRVPSVLLLRATSAIALTGAALFFAVAAIGNLTVVTVLGPMILFSVGVGAASPVAVTAAISTDPQLIGAASGLYGFMQMANGALCTLMVGLIPADPAFAAATVLLAGLLLGQSFFLLATRAQPSAS